MIKFLNKMSGALRMLVVAAPLLLPIAPVYGQNQLNENCVVSILNRTTQVQPDGSWDLPNIPSGFGPVRARATCVENGVTRSGQSEPFTITASRMNGVSSITLGSTTPIPNALTVSASPAILTQAGQPTQLSVIATYANGSTQNVTAASTGTQYVGSNRAIASVSTSGLVTAVSSGTVVIQAVNEGTQGIITVQVLIAGASHGGIPDTWIISNGFDLTNAALPAEDADRDGLSNLQEFQIGTDPNKVDTDGDGLTDGQEVLLYHSNPLLADTDGDGIPDGVEVQTNTDPASSTSFNLSKAISTLTVTPASFVLNVNTIISLASKQLTVTAKLIDGKTTVDLTSTQRGTNYISSNLNVCNFGAPDGNVFAGSSGNCAITITNSGFTAQATGVINTFSPTSLAVVGIPGFANSVAASGNYAFIAAGGAGLQVVNVTDRSNPSNAASLPLQGNANDIALLSNRAYVAAGTAGLHVIDISNPLAPAVLGTLRTFGNAMGVAVRGGTAYIANGTNLLVADVTTPASMSVIGSLPLKGTIMAVDVDAPRRVAVAAAGTTGIHVIDIGDPRNPQLFGTASTGDARDVVIQGNFAFVADFVNSTTTVDLTFPFNPIVPSHVQDPNVGGFLLDIANAGNFTLGADVFFINGIPITDVSVPTNLRARTILNFPQRDDNGMGIAVDGPYVYLATEHLSVNKFGFAGDSRLYIGQYLALDDNHVAPAVTITSPTAGSTAIQGATLPITVDVADDISVAAVNFLVNGQLMFTATSAPYQFNYVLPEGISTISIGAYAVDLGNNVGTAQPVTINLAPDPRTTVVGRVIGAGQNPVAGALVSTLGGKTGVTTADGSFSIADVPTIQGSIIARATATISGVPVAGVSMSVAPVLTGITNVGNIGLGGLIVVTTADFTHAGVTSASVIKGAAQTTIFFDFGDTGGVAVTPDGSTAVVAHTTAQVATVPKLVFLNLNSFPPAATGFVTLPHSHSVAVTSDGKFAVVDGTLSVNMSTQALISQINVGASGFAITPDNRTVILNSTGTVVSGGIPHDVQGFRVLSLSSNGALNNTGVFLANPGNGAQFVSIAPNGRFALAPNLFSSDVTVLRINATGVTVSGRTTVNGFACGASNKCLYDAAFTPDGSKAYVVSTDGSVAVLNIDAQDAVTDSGLRITIPKGGGDSNFRSIAIASDGNAYITNSRAGTVTVLDTVTNTVVGSISLGAYVNEVATSR